MLSSITTTIGRRGGVLPQQTHHYKRENLYGSLNGHKQPFLFSTNTILRFTVAAGAVQPQGVLGAWEARAHTKDSWVHPHYLRRVLTFL